MINRIILIVALLIMFVFSSKSQTKENISYDENGRISKVVFTQANQILTINYEYDKRGNLTKSTSSLVTDVEDNKASITITVAPNPSSQMVTIETPATDGENVGFVVTSVDGRELLRKDSYADASGIARVVIDATASGLASGSYQVTATTKKGKTTAGFVIGK